MDTTPSTYVLFFDLAEITELRNVTRIVCQATKHPHNPVLPVGDMHEWDAQRACPWESGTIIWDQEDRIFKMWYGGKQIGDKHPMGNNTTWVATGYATSPDGVHWDKPNLGLFEFNGNKDNNITMWGMGAICKDRLETNPARRYKAIIKGYPWELQFRINYSPDGIHWQEGPLVHPKPQGKPLAACDPVALEVDEYAPPSERYKYVWQEKRPNPIDKKPGPDIVRVKCLVSGPSVEEFGIQNLDLGDQYICLDPRDSTETENHFLALLPYQKQYVMAYEYGFYAPNDTGVYGQYVADIRLAHSRDGRKFTRIDPANKLIPRGPRGSWDEGMLVMARNIAVKDDTIYLYYAGHGEEFLSWPHENMEKHYPENRTSGFSRISRTGLATLRRDGFTCLHSFDDETPGYAITQPLRVVNPDRAKLVVNIANTIQRRSWVRVEVLDAATNQPVPGYTLDQCPHLWMDSVRAEVRWKTQSTLAGVKAEQIRLRFELVGAARLHAFTWK